MPTVFALDLGVKNTGFVILDIQKDGNFIKKIEIIEKGVFNEEDLFKFYNFLKEKSKKVDYIVYEDIFIAKNSKLALKLGEKRGVLKIVAIENGKKCFGMQTKLVKKIFALSGKAKKKQIKEVLKKILKIEEKNQHIVDAIALAYASLFARQIDI